jgi:hypothetical protein
MGSRQADPETILTPTDTRPKPPARWQEGLPSEKIPERTRRRPDPEGGKRRNAKNPRSLPVRIAVRTRQQARAQVCKKNKASTAATQVPAEHQEAQKDSPRQEAPWTRIANGAPECSDLGDKNSHTAPVPKDRSIASHAHSRGTQYPRTRTASSTFTYLWSH